MEGSCPQLLAEVLGEIRVLREEMAKQSKEIQGISQAMRSGQTPSGCSKSSVGAMVGVTSGSPRRPGFQAAGLGGLAEVLRQRLVISSIREDATAQLSPTPPPTAGASVDVEAPFGLVPQQGDVSVPKGQEDGHLAQAQVPSGLQRGVAEACVRGMRDGEAHDRLLPCSLAPSPPSLPGRVAWAEGMGAGEGAPVESAGFMTRVRRGSLDSLRRQVHHGIIMRNHTPKDDKAGPSCDAQSTRATRWTALFSVMVQWVNRLSLVALKLGGILPLSPARFWCSLVYQLAVLSVNAAIFLYFVVQGGSSFSMSRSFFLGDLVLALGSLMGLLAAGAGTGSKQLVESLTQLEGSNQNQAWESRVRRVNALDSLVTLGVWLAFLSDRLGLMFVENFATLSQAQLLHLVGVLVSSAQLACLVLVVLRFARNMVGLVDAFCSSFCRSLNAAHSVEQWNVLQATVRTASSAVERCFSVLLSTMVLLALVTVFDLRSLRGVEWAVSASGLLLLGMGQILFRAAEVTDSCVRVSQLVNATALTDDPLDEERMYLVEYIQASAAGFYIFNVRLDAGLGIKVIHYTGLMAFTIARLVLPSTGS